MKTLSIIKKNANLSKIYSNLFDVITIPVAAPTEHEFRMYNKALHSDAMKAYQDKIAKGKLAIKPNSIIIPNKIDTLVRPDAYASYKNTGGPSLGAVGKDFKAMQPKLLFESLITCLHNMDLDLDYSQLQSLEFKGGSRIAFRIPVKKFGFKTKLTKIDDTIMYLNIQTGFDGNTKTSFYITTVRLVCTNGMKATKTEFTSAFKNTNGNTGKIQVLCNEVSRTIATMDTFAETMEALQTIEVSTDMQEEYLLRVLGYNRRNLMEQHKLRKDTFERIEGAMEVELPRTGNTLFGMLNAMTFYTNWNSKASELGRENGKLADYVYQGGGNVLNNKAQKVAIEMLQEEISI